MDLMNAPSIFFRKLVLVNRKNLTYFVVDVFLYKKKFLKLDYKYKYISKVIIFMILTQSYI